MDATSVWRDSAKYLGIPEPTRLAFHAVFAVYPVLSFSETGVKWPPLQVMAVLVEIFSKAENAPKKSGVICQIRSYYPCRLTRENACLYLILRGFLGSPADICTPQRQVGNVLPGFLSPVYYSAHSGEALGVFCPVASGVICTSTDRMRRVISRLYYHSYYWCIVLCYFLILL